MIFINEIYVRKNCFVALGPKSIKLPQLIRCGSSAALTGPRAMINAHLSHDKQRQGKQINLEIDRLGGGTIKQQTKNLAEFHVGWVMFGSKFHGESNDMTNRLLSCLATGPFTWRVCTFGTQSIWAAVVLISVFVSFVSISTVNWSNMQLHNCLCARKPIYYTYISILLFIFAPD